MFKVDDSDESEDDYGWVNLINQAYEEYDKVYGVKVQQYEQEEDNCTRSSRYFVEQANNEWCWLSEGGEIAWWG